MAHRSWLPWVLLALASEPAFAARALVEPPGLGKVVKGAPRTDVERALADRGPCRDALRAPGLTGLGCRAEIAAALVRAQPLGTASDLRQRLALVADLSAAANAVASFAPLDPPPDFARDRWRALDAIARAAMASHDELALLPAGHALAADVAVALRGPADPRGTACTATQRALDASDGVGVTVEERGALLGLLTSHRCLVDEERLASRPRPAALAASGAAARVVEDTGAARAVADYASSRALELNRCKKHVDAAGRPTDPARAQECLCGAMARWRFPPSAAGARAAIPFERALVDVVVDTGGGMASCGPVRPAP